MTDTQQKRFKEIRLALKLNQQEFANILNVSQSVVSAIELNKRVVTSRTAHAICKEFNVNEEYLMCGTGEMFSKKITEEEQSLTKLLRKIESNFKKLDNTEQETILKFISMF